MSVKAYVLFKVTSGSEIDVCKKIADFDEVIHASVVYGEYDLLATISVPEFGELNNVLDRIRDIPSIVLTSTMIVAREHKGRTKRNTLKIVENLE